MKIEFYIRRGVLTAIDGGERVRLDASSGRASCKNNPSIECQKKPFEGPLPVGEYYLNPSDLSDPNFLGDAVRSLLTMSDWGDFRIRLYSRGRTKTYGRSNFFIHGGMSPGSAGCIDVGGGVFGNKLTDKLKEMIRRQSTSVPVIVKP